MRQNVEQRSNDIHLPLKEEGVFCREMIKEFPLSFES